MLVGVVMMVLALTILGLSLFSLSSYEAQFMNRSLDSEQALQSAIAGLDRARFALGVAPNHLEQVKSYLPYENVIAVTATQLHGASADTTGPIDWGGQDITIKSTARSGSVSRTVVGSFAASNVDNWYKRVLTVASGGITQYITVGGGTGLPACNTVALFDSIYVNRPPPAIPACIIGSFGVCNRFVPVPAVDPFMTHVADDRSVQGQTTIDLTDGPRNAVHFYRTNDGPNGSDNFSYYQNNPSNTVTITVKGLAVWILPRGFRSDAMVNIVSSGDPSDCLVIIAKSCSQTIGLNHFYGAIWFFGGVNSNVPLVLVSDGGVKIENFYATSVASLLPNVSAFADSVILTGPSSTALPPVLLAMHYGAARMDTTIDKLSAAGALPNAATAAPLALKPGSWHIVQ